MKGTLFIERSFPAAFLGPPELVCQPNLTVILMANELEAPCCAVLCRVVQLRLLSAETLRPQQTRNRLALWTRAQWIRLGCALSNCEIALGLRRQARRRYSLDQQIVDHFPNWLSLGAHLAPFGPLKSGQNDPPEAAQTGNKLAKLARHRPSLAAHPCRAERGALGEISARCFN